MASSRLFGYGTSILKAVSDEFGMMEQLVSGMSQASCGQNTETVESRLIPGSYYDCGNSPITPKFIWAGIAATTQRHSISPGDLLAEVQTGSPGPLQRRFWRIWNTNARKVVEKLKRLNIAEEYMPGIFEKLMRTELPVWYPLPGNSWYPYAGYGEEIEGVETRMALSLGEFVKDKTKTAIHLSVYLTRIPQRLFPIITYQRLVLTTWKV
ncbi:hypothetical protein PISMIDRAFT_15878 [Pisolithus microcarpus 441]|uniref:Unplaced genomic scaffold scaffold_176, whole genome shotgun sequence n=1 Tax=Pisolithus microcarpus 441 TaxID=765257 RepID=A0A0C9Z1U3_9AGAM|nr:hypothetical protein PISMIDRAFT_15878 [Pisolithus microcarpus 441]